MHAGARIVRIHADGEGQWSMEVLAKFEEHKSMNYGSDAQPGGNENSGPRTIVSTSFYDKLLCLWRF
jgi:diphthamide biosynthesis protein 7